MKKHGQPLQVVSPWMEMNVSQTSSSFFTALRCCCLRPPGRAHDRFALVG
jgi:hypothetical protein